MAPALTKSFSVAGSGPAHLWSVVDSDLVQLWSVAGSDLAYLHSVVDSGLGCLHSVADSDLAHLDSVVDSDGDGKGQLPHTTTIEFGRRTGDGAVMQVACVVAGFAEFTDQPRPWTSLGRVYFR
jgi:hypothetical protein